MLKIYIALLFFNNILIDRTLKIVTILHDILITM